MVVQIPVVLYSGGHYPRGFRTLDPNDTVPGTDTTAQASGNAGLVSASNKVPISGGYMTGQLFAASGVVVSGTLSRNGFNVVTVGDVETVTSTMIASGTIIDADVNISGAINATKLRFLQAGASGVARTVDSKLKDVVSVKDFGAVGDGVTNDTVAIQNALDSGAKEVVVPAGVYSITGIEIKAASAIESFNGQGMPTLKLVTGLNRIALEVKKFFVVVSNFIIDSTGTSSDGNSTVGVKQLSVPYTEYRSLRITNFSLRGMQIIQGVYNTFEHIVVQGCTYGLSFEANPVNGFGCTAFTVEYTYITGCLRAINIEGSVLATFKMCIMEYSGSSSTANGAFHGNGGALLINCYWEANNRNIHCSDASLTFVNKYELGAVAPNVITYVGTAFGDRGTTLINGNSIGTRFLTPDSLSSYDLQFGTNLIAPLAGGSVQFGKTTTETLSGTLTSATWTTIKAIPATEMTGASQEKAAYSYTVYAGYADLSTGFDFGTIFNDTLRSFSGTTPSWLRLDGQNIQINITASSYGLLYKLVLIRVFPGTT